MATSDYAAAVQQLYISYFGRPADYYGLQNFEQQLSAMNAPTDFASINAAIQNGSNPALSALVNNFNTSPESVALYGTVTDQIGVSKFVAAIYTNVLGRVADVAGLNFWVNAILSGGLSLANAAVAITQGALDNTTAQGKLDAATVQNKLDVATDFTASLNTTPAINAYSGAAAAQTARDLLNNVNSSTDTLAYHTNVENAIDGMVNPGPTSTTLTTGSDTINHIDTVNADLTAFNYNGKGPNLNAGDVISNVTNLNISDQAANGVDLIPAGTTLTNIANITLTTNSNAGNLGTTAWDTSGISGVLTSTVNSAGAGADLVTAAATTKVTVNHGNPTGGDVVVLGGSDVTVTTSGGDVIIGNPSEAAALGHAPGSAPLASQIASGVVTVVQHNTSGGGVYVNGGTDVNVSVTSSANSGAISIGNTAVNAGNTVAGAIANPTGNITVNDAGVGAISVFGGASVTVNDTAIDTAGAITIGDIAAKAPSNLTTGNIIVNETAAVTYSGVEGTNGGDINIYGGANVTVTSNSGSDITIGDDASQGTDPTGAVIVNSTGLGGSVQVAGGTDVTVTSNGGVVKIGQQVGNGGAAADNATGAISVVETSDSQDNSITIDGGSTVSVVADGAKVHVGQEAGPTGAVTVTQANVLTGESGFAHGSGEVIVEGGTDVTVTTTGGSVFIGTDGDTVGATATGAISITDTFSGSQGANRDSFTVLGGTTVSITTNATNREINIGDFNDPTIDTDGVSLKDASQYATGNVTVTNETVNGTKIVYGTSETNVVTHGGSTVSLTGGTVVNVIDANTVTAESGAGAGKPIGDSSLTTVILNGNQEAGTTTITSNALASLTVTNSVANTVTINNNTAAHALALTVGGDKATSIIDTAAGSLTVGDNGHNGAGTITLETAAATAATFTNSASQTFNLVADTALTSVTASNTGSLNLGDLSGLASLATIDATHATGAISATLDGEVTSFNGAGSTGNETITLTSRDLLHGDGSFSNIVGGSGTNTLVIDYSAAPVDPVSGVETDTALGNTSHVKNFSVLALGTGAVSTTEGDLGYYNAINGDSYYEASGFSALTVGATAGDVTFNHVAAGASLTITASTGTHIDGSVPLQIDTNVVNYVLASTTGTHNTLNLTVGVDGHSANIEAAVAAHGVQHLAINSVGNATGMNGNDVGISDSAATSVTITGDQALFVGVGSDTISFNGGDFGFGFDLSSTKITTVDASASTGDVYLGFALDTSVDGIAHTITGGSGMLWAEGSASQTGIDTITTGSGGGVITLGGAGSFDNGVTLANAAYTAGSQVIDLTASVGVSDTIVADDGAVATNNGVRGGVTGFQSGVTNADHLEFMGTVLNEDDVPVLESVQKNVVTNVAAATVVSAITVNPLTTDSVQQMANTLDETGALYSVLTHMTYTVSNGVITFGATGSHSVADFTLGQLIGAAEIIVNADAVGNEIVGFSYKGNTYLVASDVAHTLTQSANGGATAFDLDTLITLNGVSGFSGFGTTGAAGTVVADVINADSFAVNSGSSSSAVFNETGFAAQAIGQGVFAFGTSSTAITNLAASGTLTLDDGAVAPSTIGAITISQTGTSGNNSLTLDLANGFDIFSSITTKGDYDVVLNSHNATVNAFADADNTVHTLYVNSVGEGDSLTLNSISDSGLKVIDATGLSGNFDLGSLTSSISNSGLTVSIGSGSATVYASGAADVITAGDGAISVTANGSGDTITLGNGVDHVTALGANDVISVGSGSGNSVTASGSGVHINVANSNGSGDYIVGQNAIVTFSGVNAHHGDTINIGGDQTGATTAGTISFTTLTGVAHSDKIDFGGSVTTTLLGAGTHLWDAQVNVATATTLAQALDIAANISGLTGQKIVANTGVVDWFQYAGNTYVVESVNSGATAASHTALGTHDYVVELTGLVDLTHGSVAAGHIVTL